MWQGLQSCRYLIIGSRHPNRTEHLQFESAHRPVIVLFDSLNVFCSSCPGSAWSWPLRHTLVPLPLSLGQGTARVPGHPRDIHVPPPLP